MKLWMQDFGGECPKRTKLIGNDPALANLAVVKQACAAARVATTVKYTDSKGVRRFKASAALRKTQPLTGTWQAFASAFALVEML